MPRLLRKCDSHHYTMNVEAKSCQICGKELKRAAPPRFSPHDRYAKYRRAMRKISLESQPNLGNESND
ncbi:MAG: nucleolar RNA-binding Nop10p family protein [Promethearchaeota archaeon]